MEHYRLWGRVISRHRIVKKRNRRDSRRGYRIRLSGALPPLRRAAPAATAQATTANGRSSAARFTRREHFTEPIDFDKLEVELLTPDGEKKHSGPRTPLMDA